MKHESAVFRSHCHVARSLDVLGDRWTLLVVRDIMMKDRHKYSDFTQGPEVITTNILADRLRKLAEWGLIKKVPYQTRPTRYAYYLTDLGESLRPIMLELQKWGAENLADA